MNKNRELRVIGAVGLIMMILGTWGLQQIGGPAAPYCIMLAWVSLGGFLGDLLEKTTQERDLFFQQIRRWDVRLGWHASDKEYQQAQEVLDQLKAWFISFEDVILTPLWDIHGTFIGFEVQSYSEKPINETGLKFKGERIRTTVLYINDVGFVLERLEPWNPISRAFIGLLRR